MPFPVIRRRTLQTDSETSFSFFISSSNEGLTMSDVKTEKMELEFRSADDLFQNYPISIIRQVVDKSKYAISRGVHS